MAKPKLHEILAVEAGLKKTANTVLEEAKTTFEKRSEHFSGSVRTYECLKEDDPTKADEAVIERQEMVTTVNDKLQYVLDHVVRHVDTMATKDASNQIAKANIEIDGVVLVADVPVSTLLDLEDQIKVWREMASAIPTLAPGKSWLVADQIGPDVFRMEHAEVKTRTAKTLRNHVRAEATEKHPAQVDVVQVDEPVGLYRTERISSAYTPAQKSALLARIDSLHRAVKQARQRANGTEVVQMHVGRALADYLLAK